MSKKQRRKEKQLKQQKQQIESQSSARKPQVKKGINKIYYYPVLFLLGFLLYANTIPNEFAVDDSIVVSENKFTQKGFAGLQQIFTTDAFEGFFGERGAKLVAGGRYRPLSIATFAIEKELFGGKQYDPHIGHAVNAILYGLTGMIIFALLCLLFPLKPGHNVIFNLPLVVSLLFLFHPIHTEAVANIKGRDEIMVFMFSILALIYSIKYIDKGSIYYLPLMIVFFSMGLLSKENAITFIAIVPLTIYFFRKKTSVSKYLTVTVSLVVVTAIYLYVRSLYTESSITDASGEILNNPFVRSSTVERLATVLTTFVHYMKLLILPHPLSHDYYFNQIPLVTFGHPLAIFSLVFHAGLLIVVILKLIKGEKSVWLYGVLFYFITFSIVSNVFFTVGVSMSERFIYVSSFGFSILTGILLLKAYQKWNKKAAMAIFGVIILLYAVKTIDRNPDWKNNFVLFTHDVNISTNSAKLQTAAGGELIAESDRTEEPETRRSYLNRAVTHLNRALEIYPQHSNAWLLLGNATYKLDNPQGAEQYYKTALTYRPGYYDAFFNMGVIMSEMKQYTKARKYYLKAYKARPQNIGPVTNLADAYFNLNKADSSIIWYRKVLQMDPNNAATYNRIGIIYGQKLNDLPSAISNLKKAVELQPGVIKYQEDLGVAYGFAGQLQDALRIFEKIIEKNPNYASAYFNMSVTYRNLGNDVESQRYLQKAIELDPSYGNIRY